MSDEWPYVVLVTSSRDWRDRARVWDELDKVAHEAAREGFDALSVRHGHCGRGGDQYADEWVIDRQRRGWPVEADRWPAEWEAPCRHTCDHGPRVLRRSREICPAAGNYRNEDMVDAEVPIGGVLAFLMPCTKPRCPKAKPHDSHGASHCADYAEAAGTKPLRIYSTLPLPLT